VPSKLDTAGVFERVFEVYGAQASLFLPIALAVFVPVAIIQALLASPKGTNVGLILLGAIVSLAATYTYQGVLVEAVRDIQDGVRDLTPGGVVRSVTPLILPLFGLSIVVGVCVAIGFVLFIIPGLVLLTWWALSVPALVIERHGVFASVGRSRQLVRGNGWRVFGVVVVFFLMQAVISGVLGAILVGAFGDVAGNGISTLVVDALVAPLSAIAATVMYLRLRAMHGEAPPPAGAEQPANPFGQV
jgi:hypothetical protein